MARFPIVFEEPEVRSRFPMIPEVEVPELPQMADPRDQHIPQMLKDAGYDEPTQQRLLRTGVTPGTVIEFAAAHIQQENRQRDVIGQPRLDTDRQLAIQDIYKERAGRTDLSNVDQWVATREKQRLGRMDTFAGRTENVLRTTMEGLGRNVITSPLSLVAPKTSAAINRDLDQWNANKEGVRGFAMGLAPEIGTLLGALALGPPGMMAYYATRGGGEARANIHAQREAGQKISGWTEAGVTVADATIEAASAAIGYRLFGKLAGVLGQKGVNLAAKEGIRRVIGTTFRAADIVGKEALEEAATEAAHNLVAQWGYDPERAITHGILEAALTGGILAPFGAAAVGSPQVASQQGRGQAAEARQPITDTSRLLVTAKAAAEAKLPQVEAQTQQQIEETLKLPTSGEVIQVSPEGVAGTAKQQKAMEQSAAGFVQEVTEPPVRQLEAPRVRFYAGEEAAQTVDVTQPRVERRYSELIEGRIEVEKLTTAGLLKQREAKIKELQIQIRTDPVTGAGNRVAWDEGLAKLQQQVDKTGKRKSFLWLDMDQFKALNDTLGQDGGDQKLADVVRIMRGVAGAKATVARFGGDEFGVFPARGLGPIQAKRLLARIEKEVGRQEVAPGVLVGIVGGIGTVQPGGNVMNAAAEAEQMAKERKVTGKLARGEVAGRSAAEAAVAASLAAAARPAAPAAPRPPGPALGEITQSREQLDAAVTTFRRGQSERMAAEQRLADPPPGPDVPISDIVKAEIDPLGPQAKGYFGGLADVFVPLSSRIYKRSRAIFRRVKNMMFEEHESEERLMRVVAPLLRRLQPEVGDTKQARRKLSLALMGENLDAANQLLTADGREALAEIMQINRTMFDAARAAGVEIGELPGFILPREVRNYNKLKQHLGDERGFIEKTLARAAEVKGRSLTQEEQVAVVNAILRGHGPRQAGMRHAKHRRIAITENLLPFYASFEKSQMGYIRDMVKATARANFFGRSVSDTDSILESAGALVYEAVQNGELRGDHQQEMVKLIHGLILGDMARVSRMTKFLKQASYMSTLAQLGGAGLNQLVDIGIGQYRFGLKHTMKGLYKATAPWERARRIAMEELGLHEYGIEWEDIGKFAGTLDTSLKVSLFKRIDRLGKETQINAAESFLRSIAAGNRNFRARRFLQRYKGVLSETEMNATLADVRAGKRTQRTRFLHFMAITEVQPLDISEVPYDYAVNSKVLGKVDARLFYTLKTFTFKQLDFMRRETADEFAQGHIRTGARNLARLLALWVAMDLGVDLLKDFIRGKQVSAEQLPDRVVDSALSMVGLNAYFLRDLNTDPVQAIGEFFMPPSGYITDPWRDLKEAVGLAQDKPGLRFIRYIPFIGDQLYYRVGRGYYLKQEKQAKDIRAALVTLREQAQEAYDRNDLGFARNALRIYNDKRRDGARQGTKSLRKTDLTFTDLKRTAQRKERTR